VAEKAINDPSIEKAVKQKLISERRTLMNQFCQLTGMSKIKGIQNELQILINEAREARKSAEEEKEKSLRTVPESSANNAVDYDEAMRLCREQISAERKDVIMHIEQDFISESSALVSSAKLRAFVEESTEKLPQKLQTEMQDFISIVPANSKKSKEGNEDDGGSCLVDTDDEVVEIVKKSSSNSRDSDSDDDDDVFLVKRPAASRYSERQASKKRKTYLDKYAERADSVISSHLNDSV
jgi:hypothetical protein